MSLFVGGTTLLLTMPCLQNEITYCKFVNACQLKHFNPVKVLEILNSFKFDNDSYNLCIELQSRVL